MDPSNSHSHSMDAEAAAVPEPVLGDQDSAVPEPVLGDQDSADPEPGEPFEYGDDIRNSVWSKNHPAYGAALAERDRREEYLRRRLDRSESRAAEMTREIYEIVGFFAVYQSFAVATVPQLLNGDFACAKIWSPIVLTVFATFVTIIVVWRKFENLKNLESSTHREKHEHQEAAAQATSLRRHGPNFRFHEHGHESMLRPLKSKIWINRIAIVFTLLVFTAAFIVSYFVIACESFLINSWKHGLPT